MEPCVSCHMPDAMHLFRINSSSSYSTFPVAGALATNSTDCTNAGGTWSGTSCTLNANKSADGTYANAVWVDVDLACGQCHGGGASQKATTGTVATASKTLTVTDTTGFVVGERIRIAGAGSYEYEDEGPALRGDFDSYIQAIGAGSITLAGTAPIGVTNAAVVQNATKNGAAYFTKAQLAGYAKGIHNDAPFASFSTSLGSPNTLILNVDASGCTCSGSNANCDAYDWDWGDGSAHGSGKIASHTYLTGGVKAVTLTVDEFGVSSGSKTKNVTVYAPDLPPIFGGTCSFDANTWTETVTDTSTDDVAIAQVTVTWGDGSVLSSDTTIPFGPFSHVFITPGTHTVTHKVIDSIGQQVAQTCSATTAYFTISGTVFAPDGTTPVATAMVRVMSGSTVVRTAYTAPGGTYLLGGLKPGNYSIVVSKTGFTFATPAIAVVGVGPSKSGQNVTATSQVFVRQINDTSRRSEP
jgi:hypothetical protein